MPIKLKNYGRNQKQRKEYSAKHDPCETQCRFVKNEDMLEWVTYLFMDYRFLDVPRVPVIGDMKDEKNMLHFIVIIFSYYG